LKTQVILQNKVEHVLKALVIAVTYFRALKD